eukprot:gnl/MRDRNA2_/MRDRNA2_80814_c0_seq1.p1 gnl/MRDRNA2_/MRDRNA2_80814_c0~~gnl/MRDRNA2_/MRDRNA2_80814_c0_seq1.p1  ORF type:complete len:414 (-),score=82.63 gnl/MRDRNA2_/MRDRNA2_80814_c0_seq1:62-1303(-)
MGCGGSLQAPAQVQQDFHKNYTLGSKIGSGAFGAVYKARKTNGPKDTKFAVKVISKKAPDGPGPSAVTKEFYSEVEMLSACRGKYVIAFMDAYEDKSFCYLVMELCQCTILEAFLDNKDIDEADLPKMFAGMAEGISHCHQAQVVHRDIKPQNFLMSGFVKGSKFSDPSSKAVVKLCDLGMAIKMPTKSSLTEVCGTAPFMAPEMLNHLGYDYKSDVWSFGACVYLLLFGTFPYNPKQPSAAQMKQLIREGKVPISYDVPKTVEEPSEDGIEFCKAVLIRDPKERPSSAETLVMPYLRPHRELRRSKTRSGTLHDKLQQASNNAKLAQEWGRKKISPEALAKFEKELDKLAENHGVRRTSSERTMTLPNQDSRGSLKLELELGEEDNGNGYPEADGEGTIKSKVSATRNWASH